VLKLDISNCSGDQCVFHKGANAKETAEFVANQDSAKIEAKVIVKINGLELPVPDIDTDGCKYVKCPIVKGQHYAFVREAPVSKAMPNMHAEFSVHLTGDHGTLACFSFDAEYKD